jgi:2-methylaconitate cis-trans-isomerase PrpF
MRKIPCALIRGGTSKGVFVLAKYLPKDKRTRDRVILSIFGSPDPRQINGLGGADPLTSKLAIVSPSKRVDADVDYTFAQVGIATATVDYSVNCGNISSGVGPFAIKEGLVAAREPTTAVRIFNTNTKKLIIAEVPVKGRGVVTGGEFRIDGVPGTGAAITLRFTDPSGAITGKLLPTGRVVDTVSLQDGKNYSLSIVDAGNLYVFIEAREIGLTGSEGAEELDKRSTLAPLFQEIVSAARSIILPKASAGTGPSIKLAIVNEPLAYVTDQGDRHVKKADMDLTARIITLKRAHKAYAVTGAIATTAAAFLPGSVVNRVVRKNRKNPDVIRIGHPAGIIEARAECSQQEDKFLLKSVSIYRTARYIMEGVVYAK